ncbi:transcription factor Clamp isoform X3 [Anabrus simplex]|uniref:transcription factor Clamp isoform X3 n=1 Tax=Anabrus simplex TaxID=316456 RepID=UPI0035A3C7AF
MCILGTNWTIHKKGPVESWNGDMEQEVAVKSEPMWPLEDGIAREGDQDQEQVVINPVKLEPELIILTGVKVEPQVEEEMPQDPEQNVDPHSKSESEVTVLAQIDSEGRSQKQVALRTPVPMESGAWLAPSVVSGNSTSMDQRQQSASEDHLAQLPHHESQVNQGQLHGLLKIPEAKCSVYSNSCTQTDNPSVDYNNSYVEVNNGTVIWKNDSSVTFNSAGLQHLGANTQMFGGEEERNKATEKMANSHPSEIPFCYNVNILQKVQLEQAGSVSMNNSGAADDNSYRFEVTQPFGYSYALVNQMTLAAAGSSTFKCEVCGLVFPHLSLLNHHKVIHNSGSDTLNIGTQNTSAGNNSERQYKCDMCESSFNLPGELRSHKRVAHRKIMKNNSVQSQVQAKCCDSCGVEVGKYIKCECCQEGDPEGTRSNESGPEGDNVNVTKCHKCCGSGTAVRDTVVDKLFQCKVCDAEFSRYSSLWSHKRLHSGERPFKCETCGLAFAKPAYLKNHSRVHTGEKPYGCSTCGMRFSQSPHLKNHERIHSGERPYHCQFCNKTFARHSTLWNHRRIHTGEKPYRCDVCDAAFNQATHLKNHLKVHSGEKPHRCDVCDVSFADKFTLKRHMAVHEKYKVSSTEPGDNNTSSDSNSNTSLQTKLYNCADEDQALVSHGITQ